MAEYSKPFDVFLPSAGASAFIVRKPDSSWSHVGTDGAGLTNIDTVFYSSGAKVTCEEVRRSLIDHDGYPPNIIVKRGK